jgi:hypothetical protein
MKKQQAKIISITASCGGSGCSIPAHEKVIPWLIKTKVNKAA